MVAAGRVELVIFDCDGVLVDSEALACACFSAALATLGLMRSPEELDLAFRGQRMADCLQQVEEWLGRPLPTAFEADLQRATFARMRAELQPVKGVRSALETLCARPGTALCVASSGEPEKIEFALEITGLRTFFADALFSGTTVPHGKPAPDLFLHAAAAHGVPASACVVIEDSPAGIAAGHAAGMPVCAYQPDGVHTPAPKVGRQIDFHRMDALPALIDALQGGLHEQAARLRPAYLQGDFP